jgi:hypothetical protein
MSSQPALEIQIEQIMFISNGGKMYDLRSEFLQIEITESVLSPFTRGWLSFHDINNITEAQDAVGGGYLRVKFRTNEDFAYYENTFWIYKVGDDDNLRKEFQYNNRKITMFFASVELRMELFERYSNYYENKKPHEIVSKVCADMLNIDSLKTIDDTQDSISIVTPYAWSPLGIIDYCKKKSFSVSNQDNGYLFYNNASGFHYVSFSEILKQSYKYEMNMQPPDNDYGEKYFSSVNKIISYKTIKHLDLIESWMSHRYGGTVHTVNTNDIRLKENVHNFETYIGKTVNLGTKTTSSTLDTNNKAWHVPYYGTFPQYKLPTYTRMNLMEDNQISVISPGDSGKMTGDIIKIVYPSKGEFKALHDQLDGNWLALSLTHRFNQRRQYTNQITLAKDGFKTYEGSSFNTIKNNP